MQTNNCNDWSIYVYTYTTCEHIDAKFELATTKIVACSTVYRAKN